MKNNNKTATSWTQRLFIAPMANKTGAYHKTYYGHRYAESQKTANQSCFSEIFSNKHQPYAEAQPNFEKLFGQINHRPADLKPESPLFPADTSGRNANTRFTVLNCYNETPDAKTFRLARISGEKVDYLPGQYMTLTVTIEGKEYKRSYSLASSPTNTGILEITVKRDSNGGLVSNWLNDYVNVGDTLSLKGSFGKFTCAVDTPNKILFLAAGSGIVPIMSMLRWLDDTEKQADIILLLSFRNYNDIIYRRELELITSRHRNIKMYLTLTKESQTIQWGGLTGRFNKDMLTGLLTDIPERAIYLCGPDAFMTECRQTLQELGHPPEQLFCESFCVDAGQTRQPVSANLATVSKAPGNYQIRFVRSGINILADGRTNLLELAEQSGVKIEHECRSGSCGECMVKCLDGEVNLAGQTEIDEIDQKQGWVYACCAYPASNVQLDI
jgi:glycine betaine catabolism B